MWCLWIIANGIKKAGKFRYGTFDLGVMRHSVVPNYSALGCLVAQNSSTAYQK